MFLQGREALVQGEGYEMSEIPDPGSREAIEAGCCCAVLDNGHGRGYMGQAGIFVITARCPLHGLGEGVDGAFLTSRQSHPITDKEQT